MAGLLSRFGRGVTGAIDRMAYGDLPPGLLDTLGVQGTGGIANVRPDYQQLAQALPQASTPEYTPGESPQNGNEYAVPKPGTSFTPAQDQQVSSGLLAQQAPAPQGATLTPNTMAEDPALRKQMRVQFLSSLGAALSSGQPLGMALGSGRQNYQQNMVGQLEETQKQKLEMAHRTLLAQFQQEMAQAATPDQQAAVVMRNAAWLGPEAVSKYMEAIKAGRPPEGSYGTVGTDIVNLHTGELQVGPLSVNASVWKGYLDANGNNPTKAYAAMKEAERQPPVASAPKHQLVQDNNGNFVQVEIGPGKTIPIVDAAGKPLQGRLPDTRESIELSPEALDQAALLYLQTGQTPTVGYGKDAAEMRSAIMNHAAKLQPGKDLAAAKMDYRAIAGAVTDLEKQQGRVLSFETTASKNLDLADSISRKVDRTGVPVVNRFLLYIKGEYGGDTNTQLLNNAVETAASEYAKVVSGGMNGPVSDSAREHARVMLRAALGKGTFMEAAALMKQEMGNRKEGYAQQLAELRGRQQSQPNTAQPQGNVEIWTRKNGKVVKVVKP